RCLDTGLFLGEPAHKLHLHLRHFFALEVDLRDGGGNLHDSDRHIVRRIRDAQLPRRKYAKALLDHGRPAVFEQVVQLLLGFEFTYRIELRLKSHSRPSSDYRSYWLHDSMTGRGRTTSDNAKIRPYAHSAACSLLHVDGKR